MYTVVDNYIRLTRGDTFRAQVSIFTVEGEPYVPEPGDLITFSVKKRYTSKNVVISKTVPNGTLILELEPTDTANLDVGVYVYDVDIIFPSGRKDTFIKGKLKLTPEV